MEAVATPGREVSMKVKMIIRKWAAPVLCGLFLFLCMKFVLMIGYVPTASMEPTIAAGSYILGLRIHGELQRGDIVVFRLDGRNLVKRIVAVPGDVVYVDESTFTVRINSVLEGATQIIEVPVGHFYMLGDDPAKSSDSRYWDDPFIHKDDILARLFIK